MNISIFFRLSIIFIAFISLLIIDGVPNTSNFTQIVSLSIFAAITFGLVILGLIKCYKKIRAKNWKQVMIEGIIFAVIAILFFLPLEKIRLFQNFSAYVTLFFVYPEISDRISKLPTNLEAQVVVLETGGTEATARGIAYDNTKEIEKPAGSQTAIWKQMATPIGGAECWKASHLIGNYYRWSGYYICE